MLCALSDFHSIRPRQEMDQELALDWIASVHAHGEGADFQDEIRQKLTRIGLGREKIQKRGIQSDLLEVYPVAEERKGKGFSARSQVFDREATGVFEAFYPEGAVLPGHLIHVTCTGYVSPSPAQRLVSRRQAGDKTTVTHAYHMGCYGAVPAIRIGAGFACLPSIVPGVDIVHTELCSLHMHPLVHRSEQLLVESLFGDGFIKYSVGKEPKGPHLKVLAIQDELIPESEETMTWRCGDHGLEMTLSKKVPVLITQRLPHYLKRLINYSPRALFAVHPGGPKILQQVKELLSLDDSQLAHSTRALRQYGNMSSATLPHIWKDMLDDPDVGPGTQIVSLAFGPGLNIAGGLFEKGG